MKRSRVFLVVLLLVLLGMVTVPMAEAQDQPSPTGQYIVLSPSEESISPTVATQTRALGGRVLNNYPQFGVTVVSSTSPNFARRMRALGFIVAPNRILRNTVPDRRMRANLNPQAAGGASNPFFTLQWNIPAVRAPEAWAEGRRGQGVRVAVLDTGFYLNMPDVNWNTNLAISFVPGEGVQYAVPANGDTFSHGTFVSTIVAGMDNTFGTVGVAPEAEIVPVKVLSDLQGYGEDSWVLSGMLYAALIDADVVNMSLGGICDINVDEDCRAIKRLYDRVVRIMRRMDVTVVAATGNQAINFDANRNLIDLPAMADGVIGVSATAPEGWAAVSGADPRLPASYSNYGRRIVDFAAPGGDDDYAGQANCAVGSFAFPCFVFDMILGPGEVVGSSVGFYFGTGTSFASPHVAGIAAQIIGAAGGNLNPQQVENRLRRFADSLAPRTFYGDGFALAND